MTTEAQPDLDVLNVAAVAIEACAMAIAGMDDAIQQLGLGKARDKDLRAMLLTATNGRVRTDLHAASLLVRSDYCAQALVLERSTYEIAVRTRWASLGDEEILRLQLSWSVQSQKWARDAVGVGQHAAHAQTLLQNSAQDIDRLRRGGKVKEPPDLKTMLCQIEKRDAAHGRLTDPTGMKVSDHYPTYYRVLSKATHGFPTTLTKLPSEVTAGYAAVVALQTAHLLADANREMAPSLASYWEPTVTRMLQQIHAKIDELGLDQETE